MKLRLFSKTTLLLFSKRLCHIPVLADAVVCHLQPQPSQTFLDMTFGGGGHTRSLFAHCPDLKAVVLDKDPYAVTRANVLAEQTGWQITPQHGNFSDLPSLLSHLNYGPESFDMVLMDLGTSSYQLDDPDRGFSLGLLSDTCLDMRMDQSNNEITAKDVVNNLDAEDLAIIFFKYGEEKLGRKFANSIVDYRLTVGPIQSCKELAGIIEKVCGFSHRKNHSHVATKIFQALRIFVNDELNQLVSGLSLANQLLKPGGKCAVISFHSLEDRIVKRTFHNMGFHKKSRWEITSHFETPSDEEINSNFRSRSAKLRVGTKIR